jgi:hypothetical protein
MTTKPPAQSMTLDDILGELWSARHPAMLGEKDTREVYLCLYVDRFDALADRARDLKLRVAGAQKERDDLLGDLAGVRAALAEAKALNEDHVRTIAKLSATAPFQHQTDDAYEQRNRLVAALARLVLATGGRAGLRATAIDGWDAEWHNCCWIELPTGQASWHFRDRELHLFEGLPNYPEDWDGHSTAAKHERLQAAWREPEAPLVFDNTHPCDDGCRHNPGAANTCQSESGACDADEVST